MTAACAAVARQERIGAETLRRWALQAEIDEGTRPGTTSQEHEQIKRLKAENARLREDVAILKTATTCFAGNSTPQPLIAGFIDTVRSEGHAALVDLPSPVRTGLPDRRAHLTGMTNP